MHHCQRNLQRLKGRFQRGENQLEMRIVPVYIHDGGRTLLERRSADLFYGLLKDENVPDPLYFWQARTDFRDWQHVWKWMHQGGKIVIL